MTTDIVRRIPVLLDFLQATQLIEACHQREDILEAHVLSIRAKGGTEDRIIGQALVETIAAEFAIRAAFRLERSEALMDEEHEAGVAEMVELHDAEFGEWTEAEAREAWGR